MAYQVDRFNGTFLVAVADGSIDTTTDLRLVGKNYAGYGELQNENFLHLLENFANTTAPPKAISGQLWYDSGNKKLKFYDGSRFKVAGGAEVSPTPPTGLTNGDFWWNSDAKQLYAWDGSEFELIGPEISSEAGQSVVTAATATADLESGGSEVPILKIFVDNRVVAVVSKVEFNLVTADEIGGGFVPPLNEADKPFIAKGITLSTDSFKLHGTTTNAERLGGELASEYVLKDQTEFNGIVTFRDSGFKFDEVGDDPKHVVSVVQNNLVVESVQGSDVLINIKDGNSTNTIARFSSNFVNPGLNDAYSLGTTGLAWKEVTATDFVGKLTGNVVGNSEGTHKGNVVADDDTVMINATTKQIGGTGVTITGNFVGAFDGNVTGTTDNTLLLNGKPSSSAAVADTIALRTETGDLAANNFIGTASNANRVRIDNTANDGVWNPGDISTQYRTAKTSVEAWTIAARDGAGDISANLFKGTATAAQYADLAEKYLTDRTYEPGTVVVVGGDAEVTASSEGHRAIGVVSTDPAFMMNSELEGGTYIALKGRVPVKVAGHVSKGDSLRPGDNGYAVFADPIHSLVFAIALESNDREHGIIEAVIL